MKVLQIEGQKLQDTMVKVVDFGPDNSKIEIGADLTDGKKKWRVIGHVYPNRNESKPTGIVVENDFDLAVGNEVSLVPLKL
jgi:hypothetical protein